MKKSLIVLLAFVLIALSACVCPCSHSTAVIDSITIDSLTIDTIPCDSIVKPLE
jgi:hypothetical protein